MVMGTLSGWSGSCGGRPAVTTTVEGRNGLLCRSLGDDSMSSSLAVVLTTLLGGRAFAERHGEPPAKVVALHGWGRTRADWNATLQGYDALALDLPGFGATPPPEEGWSTADYAGWVRECLADAELDRPVLVGHSFGGRAAVHVAAYSPDRVRGVVLTGVPLLRPQTAPGKPPFGFRALRQLNKWGFISNERMEQERRKRGSADYVAAEGVMREVLVKAVNEDYGAELDAIAANGVPVAMVWGEHDTAAAPAMAEQARARMGDAASLVVVAGSAHLLDDALVKELRSAIDGLAARP
jgi:pimeloyl-ACP methyl ester carboxylesterase